MGKNAEEKKYVYGRHVFVTGATSGIGRACARLFARNGYEVTGVSRSAEEVTEEKSEEAAEASAEEAAEEEAE